MVETKDTEKDLFEIEEETAEEPKAGQGEKKTESKSKTEDASKEENEPVKDAALEAYDTEKEVEKETIQSFKERIRKLFKKQKRQRNRRGFKMMSGGHEVKNKRALGRENREA